MNTLDLILGALLFIAVLVAVGLFIYARGQQVEIKEYIGKLSDFAGQINAGSHAYRDGVKRIPPSATLEWRAGYALAAYEEMYTRPLVRGK